MPSSLIPILMIAAFAGLALFTIRRARKLKEAERAALQRLGFVPRPEPGDDVRRTIGRLQPGENKTPQVRNIHEYRSLDYRILRFELMTRRRNDHNRLVYALNHPGLDFPRFSVVPALKLPGVLGRL